MEFKFASRMETLPPYLFAEINRMKAEMTAKGVDVIDLGIGDPDIPTSEIIVKAMQEEVAKPENHNYPPYNGLAEFREAIRDYFEDRYSVKIHPEKEIWPLIGSKEAIFHVPFFMCDEGDYVLVPDPGYPVYSIAANLMGARVHNMPLLKENNFLPDLNKIPEEIASKSKVLFVNYPNNPTSAGADAGFFKRLVDFAKRHNIAVFHDAAYIEVFYGKPPISILEIDNAKDCCVEFHSLSKTFNMTGWRVGFVVGNESLVGTLGRLKTNIDSSIFKAIQRACIVGLRNYKEITSKSREIFKDRKERYSKVLREIGFNFKEPDGTFYFWIEVPKGLKSKDFVTRLLEKTGVVVTPGIGMGPSGDKFFRISLTAPEDRLKEGLERLKGFDPDNL